MQIQAELPQAIKKSQRIAFSNAWLISPSFNSKAFDTTIIIQDGLVQELAPTKNLKQKYRDETLWVDASNYIISPGLIDSHTHLSLNFLKGLAHSQSDVVHDLFFPTESQLTEELCEKLAYSSILAGLRSGVTCFVDHYYKIKGVGRALEKAGLRGLIGEVLADTGSAFPNPNSLDEFLKEIDQWPFGELIQPFLAPHSTNSTSPEYLRKIAKAGKQQELSIHMHLAQNQLEFETAKKNYAKSPVQLAAEAGILSDKTLAVHLLYLDQNDFQILKDSGASVGFCPSSQSLFDRVADIKGFVENQLPVCLATDCASTQDQSDLLNEMKLSLTLAKDRGLNHLTAEDVLSWTTTQPAKVFGQTQIGDIQPGMSADMVFSQIDLAMGYPYRSATSLIYNTSQNQIKHVMVNGRWVLFDGALETLSEANLHKDYQEAVKQIRIKAKLPATPLNG